MLGLTEKLLHSDREDGFAIFVAYGDAAACRRCKMAGRDFVDLALKIERQERSKSFLQSFRGEASRVRLTLEERQQPVIQSSEESFVTDVGPRVAFHHVEKRKARAESFNRVRPAQD